MRSSIIMPSGDATLGVSEQCEMLEKLLHRLLHKDSINIPNQLEKHDDIKAHLEKLRQYFKVSGITKDETMLITLFNTLNDEMRFELCGQLEFKDHEDDYAWIENKLLELFKPKESEITPLVKLFTCKQKPDQPLREFLSEIRVQGYKLLKALDPKQREKHLIDAFTKGLRNEELQHALTRVEIKTLDDAYNLVKKEKKSEDCTFLRKAELGSEQASSIERLQNQMTMVQKQLSYIVTILEKVKPSYADVTRRPMRQFTEPRINEKTDRKHVANGRIQQRPQQRPQQGIQCWTCGKFGHVARFCDQNRCSTCGRQGHRAMNCRSRTRPSRFRQMWEDNVDTDWDSQHMGDGESEAISEQSTDEPERRNDIIAADVHTLTIHDKKTTNRRTKDNRPTRKVTRTTIHHGKQYQYPDEINDLYEYIQGRRSWKNVRLNKAETLISKSHMEKAENKPLIIGKCEGHTVKLFLDTGAEINVIDKTFLRNLNISSDRIHRDTKVIKCANDSKMDTRGWINLKIGVAGRVRPCKFWVVERLFPRVIVGIRGMKDMRVSVDPANNCVWMNNVKIPLMSRIQNQSVCEESENEQ